MLPEVYTCYLNIEAVYILIDVERKPVDGEPISLVRFSHIDLISTLGCVPVILCYINKVIYILLVYDPGRNLKMYLK